MECFISTITALLPLGSLEDNSVNYTTRRCASKLYYKKMRLTVQRPNNCVILHNGDVFEISNFLQTNNSEQMMYGRVLSPIRSLFLYPMDSKILGIVVVNSSLCELQCVPIDCLSKKAIKIPIPNNTTDFAIVPFLHDS